MTRKWAGGVPRMKNNSVILCEMYRTVRAMIEHISNPVHLLLSGSGEVRNSGRKEEQVLRN